MCISEDDLYAGFVRSNGTILICDLSFKEVYISNVKVNLLEITKLNDYFVGIDELKLYLFHLPDKRDESNNLVLIKTIDLNEQILTVTAAIATDNTHLFLGSTEGFIQFWSLTQAKCLVNFPRAHDFEIKGFVLSKDSRYLISYDK